MQLHRLLQTEAKKSRLEARKEKCEIYCFREAVAAKGIKKASADKQHPLIKGQLMVTCAD